MCITMEVTDGRRKQAAVVEGNTYRLQVKVIIKQNKNTKTIHQFTYLFTFKCINPETNLHCLFLRAWYLNFDMLSKSLQRSKFILQCTLKKSQKTERRGQPQIDIAFSLLDFSRQLNMLFHVLPKGHTVELVLVQQIQHGRFKLRKITNQFRLKVFTYTLLMP